MQLPFAFVQVITNAEVYEAKQLMKVLDDLADEGYTELNEKMEEDEDVYSISLSEIKVFTNQ